MFYFDIDDVEVTALPSCFAPLNPNVTALTAATADLSWTASAELLILKCNTVRLVLQQGQEQLRLRLQGQQLQHYPG